MQNLIVTIALSDMMKHVSPDPEVEKENTCMSEELEHLDEVKPAPKKAKTALGKLLGGIHVYGKF